MSSKNTHLSPGYIPSLSNPPYTFLKAVHKFVKVTFVANFDESPISFNGEFTRYIVVGEKDDNLQFETRGSEDGKRMFTCVSCFACSRGPWAFFCCRYLPCVAVSVDPNGLAPQPKPIVIFKGEGKKLQGCCYNQEPKHRDFLFLILRDEQL